MNWHPRQKPPSGLCRNDAIGVFTLDVSRGNATDFKHFDYTIVVGAHEPEDPEVLVVHTTASGKEYQRNEQYPLNFSTRLTLRAALWYGRWSKIHSRSMDGFLATSDGRTGSYREVIYDAALHKVLSLIASPCRKIATSSDEPVQW